MFSKTKLPPKTSNTTTQTSNIQTFIHKIFIKEEPSEEASEENSTQNEDIKDGATPEGRRAGGHLR